MRIPKLLALFFFIGFMIKLNPGTTKAQANIDYAGSFGVGVMIGEPTGVTIKYWNNSRSAFVIGAAWSPGRRNESVHLHADFLLHSWFRNGNRKNMAFYYALGGRTIFGDDATAGVRVPIGLNYVFEAVPFDIFVEAVPILDIIPAVDLAGNGAVGVRYYF